MKNAFIVGSSLLALAASAHAGLTVYDSESDWVSVTSGITSENLEGIAGFESYVYLGVGQSLDVGTVDFITSTSDSNTFVIGDMFYSPWANFSSQEAPDGTNGTTMDLPDSTSFALFLGTFDASDPVYVTFSNGDSTVISGFDVNSEFVGFTDSSAFDWVNVTQYNGEVIDVGPVAYGTSTASSSTPGPAALAPFALGLLARRRRRA